MAIAPARETRSHPRENPSLRPSADRKTVADLLKQLGDIPPDRVRLYPAPGTATENDVIRVLDHENRPCELVDGTLVVKRWGSRNP
jgi:hypothetical protein